MTSGTQLPMKRMVFVGVVIAAVLAGCSDEPSTDDISSTTVTSTQETTSVSTTVEPPASTSAVPPVSPAPTVESEAAATPDEAQIPTGSDMPHGEQLYTETCEQFISAIDALAATGAVSRQQSADGISAQLQTNPSWSTLPPEDQQEILRGLDAAGRGSC